MGFFNFLHVCKQNVSKTYEPVTCGNVKIPQSMSMKLLEINVMNNIPGERP